MLTSEQIHQQVALMLGGRSPAKEIAPDTFWRRLKVPRNEWVGIDHCFEVSGHVYLVYDLETVQIPDRIEQASELTKNSSWAHVIVVARDRLGAKPPYPDGESTESPPPATRAAAIAESITDECLKNRIGLIAEGSGKLHLIFPPNYPQPTPVAAGEKETGHIPGWLKAKVLGCKGFSPALAECLRKFNDKYESAIRKDKMRYTHEAHLLRNLAESISEEVPRFFFPLDLLEALRSWEQSGVVKKRDHFFHTFNNFFAGLLVLGYLCPARPDTVVPETYIHHAGTNLRPWEVLWPLVSLLHDPGYMSEEITSMFSYGLGIRHGALSAGRISEADKENIRNLWDTEFAIARKDLVHLFDVVSGRWALTGSSEFEAALGRAYFNGTKCGHSLLSGLRIITACNGADSVSLPSGYDEQAAKKACIIAALSMMFHDPHTREVFDEHKIAPISFELLPYASTLVFVDALQEDRRDIKNWEFPKACIFSDLEVDASKSEVCAVVDLEQIPIKYWAWKILEFESSLAWINNASKTKFSIDYRTARNLHITQPASTQVPNVSSQVKRRRKSEKKKTPKGGKRLSKAHG